MRAKTADRGGAGGVPVDGGKGVHWRRALWVAAQVALVGWVLGISFYFYNKQGYLLLIRRLGEGLFW